MIPAAVVAAPLDYNAARAIVSLSQPAISPDGKHILFMRSTQDFEKDRRLGQLMLIDVRTKRMRALTTDRHGISDPAWSRDGASVAFLAPGTRDGDSKGKTQIFVLPLEAGGEARQVSDAPNGIDSYAWSPDGSTFAYVTQNDDPDKKAIEQHLDAFEVFDNDYLHQSASIPSHLWLISANGGKARRLTSGSWSLGIVDPYGSSDLSWSADSRRIVFDHYPTADNGDTLGTVVDVIDVKSGKRSALNGVRGERGGHFAPVGDAIAYDRNTGGDPTNGVSVYVTHNGRDAVNVRRNVGRNINGWDWSPDGKSLWLFGPDGDRVAGWYVSADGSSVKRIGFGDVAISTTSNVSKTNAIAFVGTRVHAPAELFYLASPSSKPVQLTSINAAFAKRSYGRVLALHWHNDGFSENGIVTLPPNYDARRAYPLVLIVHGGPQSASTLAFSVQNQVTASHGYIVFNPNYRGSTNLGDAYEHAISRDAGDGPGRDVMAGIAQLERTFKVDRSRMAVTGWSYGGYMTSWMEGHYNIWKAAVAGAALNDWTDDFNLAFYVYTDVPWFPGPPGNPKYAPMWRAQSPITYAQNIKAPTLIMGDIGDNNVVITNSFKMYHALRDNGTTAEFVAYPVHGHFPGDPAQSEDVYKRWLAWLDKYLQVTK
ncbi:MAG TPA: prolyl oligopeptidase family serine peptidase [Candidatus Baltobacteraceae bacterium]|nr:prolyl oligopeptidase family serine peptidase [Candidatus Baltobacteraceae bacterium]